MDTAKQTRKDKHSEENLYSDSNKEWNHMERPCCPYMYNCPVMYEMTYCCEPKMYRDYDEGEDFDFEDDAMRSPIPKRPGYYDGNKYYYKPNYHPYYWNKYHKHPKYPKYPKYPHYGYPEYMHGPHNGPGWEGKPMPKPMPPPHPRDLDY